MDKTDSPLDKLAEGNNFVTDKSKYGHNFNKLYHKYFQEYRDDPLNLLEIGIAAGHSIQMWAKYFSNGKFVCLDHDIKHYEYPQNDRIIVAKGDQRDTTLLNELNNQHGPFDIIIDDGSHIDSYTKITFDTLFPLLKSGGIYVVEDLHTSYHNGVHGIPNTPHFINYIKELIDYVNSHGYCMSGNVVKCSQDENYQWCQHHKMEKMDKLIEFIHFYKSIVFIKKY
tara:strand:+ start:6235 stop:6909 length:675 start_codon:yes stop_codon:yes gene_type:complete